METNKEPEKVTEEELKMVQKVTEDLEERLPKVSQGTSESPVTVQKLIEKVEELEKAREADRKQLEMLESVADKGRMFNYRNQRATKRPMKVQLATYEEKILIGWKTTKDILVKNPTTGLTVGEEQEIELLFLDKEDNITKELIKGYPRFSDIRYSDRIEAEITGKTEDADGNITFDIFLPDGRQIKLSERFVN